MKTKKWIVMSVCFILSSAIIFVGVMSILNWDFLKLDTTEYEVSVYTVNEQFKNISINTNAVDILFFKSNDDECKIECFEHKKENHNVRVQDETLKIEINKTQNWYDNISVLSFKEPQIKVTLPRDKYESLLINTSTSDIEIPSNFTFDNIDITGSTGDIDCSASATNQLKIKLSTGDVDVENIIAQSIDISVTTGDIELDRCDANEIFLKTNTGDVEGSLLSQKLFVCNTDTGDIDVPFTTEGGRCEITTDTGDIEIKIID